MVQLEASKLFGHLNQVDLEKIRSATKEIAIPQGTQIFEVGDPGDGVYVVKSGQVDIEGMLSSGKPQMFATVPPGDFFGEMAVLDDLPRSAGARAKVDTVVHFVPREVLTQLLEDSPELAVRIIQETSRRLREFNEQYLETVLRVERMAVVGRFASSIIHDLKTPLTVIEMAKDAACNPDIAQSDRTEAGARISRQLDGINGLVNDILEFTSGTPTKKALVFSSYGDFVRPLIKTLQQDNVRKSIRIDFSTPPPAVKIPMDPKRLTRVFVNLIANAVDVLPEDGLITLRFQETADEVVTQICDDGPGIPPEILSTLFDEFVTCGKARGTGLGLSICQRIIQEHGGTITAHNNPGGGATFSFTLPKSG